MKSCHSLALLFAASLAVAGVAIGYPALGAAPAAAPPAGGGLQILEFKPAMDDLMTMLIQPRHMKLYYAGQQKNWTLAAFELNELGSALRRIGQTIPKYRNISVDATVGSIFASKIQAMDAAINVAKAETRKETMALMRSIAEAEAFVMPWVGKMTMAFDSAADVYKAALTALEVDIEGMHPDAYRPVLSAQPKPGETRAPTRIAMDASTNAGALLSKALPNVAARRVM